MIIGAAITQSGLGQQIAVRIFAKTGNSYKRAVVLLSVSGLGLGLLVQWRGLIRDVTCYRESTKDGGNLNVLPVYRKAIARAHLLMLGWGLRPTETVTNLGHFNASPGENGFHMNLMLREFAQQPGSSGNPLRERPEIRFLPLQEAITFAQENPQKVDQMTQTQLYLLALHEGIGFNFR